LVSVILLRLLRRKTSSWCRRAVISASSHAFDLKGETKMPRTNRRSSIIHSAYAIRSLPQRDEVFGTDNGLRHNLATRLKEAGADDGTIADLLGQRTTAMSRHYSAEADLPESTRALMMRLNLTGVNESDTSDGKPGGKLVRVHGKDRGPTY